MTHCSKPGCVNTGAAILGYHYAGRTATLDDPVEGEDAPPHLYVLCAPCAERLTAPRGWTIDDRRSEPPLFVPREGSRVDVIRHLDLTGSRHPTPAADPPKRQLFFGSSA